MFWEWDLRVPQELVIDDFVVVDKIIDEESVPMVTKVIFSYYDQHEYALISSW